MDLQKAFDLQGLVNALKAKGLPDAEKLVAGDLLPVIFDWLNSSVKLEAGANPLIAVAVPVLEVLESKAEQAVDAAFGITPSP